MPNSRLTILVPVKPLALAKSRLAGVDDATRRASVTAMLSRVLGVIPDIQKLVAVTIDCRVITDDSLLRHLASVKGATPQADYGHDLNESLANALGLCFSEGTTAALYLGADLPLVTATDVARIVEMSDGLTRPTAVRAARDGGTNALLVPSACAMRLAFGQHSFERHAEAASAVGATLTSVDAPGIAFDVDTMDDLHWALANIDGFAEEVDAAKALIASAPRSSL